MNTLSLEVTGIKDVDMPIIQEILKKFKVKSRVIREEKDDTKMTKEEFYQMIDERSRGKFIEMPFEELKKKMLE